MRHFAILIIYVLFNSNSIIAQQLITETFPSDPFWGYYKLTRTKALSCTSEYFVLNNDPIKYETIYKRSNDGLRDTIYSGGIFSSNTIYISYYPDGKIESYSKQVNNTDNGSWFYKYDEKGRIKEGRSPNQMATYYYTNTGIDSISYYNYERFVDKWFYAGCVLLEYKKQEEGYMIGNEYTYDNKGRLIKDITETAETYYTYTDSGYIKTLNQKYGPNFIIEYIFNKNGDIEKEIWWNEFGKSIDHALIHYYTYPSSTANEAIKILDKIYSISNEIIIESENCKNIMIYSISGILLKNIRANNPITRIPMDTGLYIVSTGNNSQKVFIR